MEGEGICLGGNEVGKYISKCKHEQDKFHSQNKNVAAMIAFRNSVSPCWRAFCCVNTQMHPFPPHASGNQTKKLINTTSFYYTIC